MTQLLASTPPRKSKERHSLCRKLHVNLDSAEYKRNYAFTRETKCISNASERRFNSDMYDMCSTAACNAAIDAPMEVQGITSRIKRTCRFMKTVKQKRKA